MGNRLEYLLILHFVLEWVCIAEQDTSGLHQLSASQFIPMDRNLALSSAKLKISLTQSFYSSQKVVVSVQDPCTVSNASVCVRDLSNILTQIPQPILIPVLISTPSLLYEYSGYYTSPITLDIYTTGVFTKRHYSNLNLTGSLNEYTIDSLYFYDEEGQNTSSFDVYGNLRGPKDGTVDFNIYHNYEVTIWIDGVQIYYKAELGSGAFNFSFEKDRSYNLRIILNNSNMYIIHLELKWNIDGSYKVIDSNYMYPFTRQPGLPYQLSDLKVNTYCDDIVVFRCLRCDGVCSECEDNTTIKICTSCKDNAYLIDGNCICNPKFYLSASDPYNCLPCTAPCDECEEVAGDYRCKTCLPGFYLSASDPYNCLPCTGLCNECEEVAGDYRCKTCLPGFYLSASDPYNCLPCTGLCNECEEIAGDYRCKTCLINATYYTLTGDCICNDGFYLSNSNPRLCAECNPLCSRCEENLESLICTECKKTLDPYACEYCMRFEKDGEDWKCKECKGDFHIGISGNCDECKPGYVKLESESLICKREIDHCIMYDLYSQESKCTQCKAGYAVGPDYECSTCDEGYLYITQDPLVCEREIQHCINYNSDEGKLKCLECESGHVLLTECKVVIANCLEYEIQSNEHSCKKCLLGYELDEESKCSKCGNGYTNNEDECVPETVVDHQDEDSDIESSDEEQEEENITQTQVDRGKVVDSSNSIATNTASASTSLSSLISMDPNTLILFMNTIQLISYIQNLNITLPFEIRKQQSSMNDFMRKINILSNIKIKDIDLNDYIRSELDDEYSYLAKTIYTILALMIVISQNVIIYLCCKYCKGKLKEIATRVLRYFKYTIYIQLYATTYLNIIDASLSKLLNVIYN